MHIAHIIIGTTENGNARIDKYPVLVGELGKLQDHLDKVAFQTWNVNLEWEASGKYGWVSTMWQDGTTFRRYVIDPIDHLK